MIEPSGNQLNRSVQLVSSRAKRLFDPPEWKRVLRLAAWKAGMLFIDKWLPMRWDPQYARRIGYSGKGGHDGVPYYEKGTWIKNAQRAYPKASVNGSGLKLRVAVPIGHAITTKIAKDFTKITEQERSEVAQDFVAEAMEIVSRGTSKKVVVGKTGRNGKAQYMTKWVKGKNGKIKKKRVLIKAKTRSAVIYGRTRRLSSQDRALSKAITSKGGFRGGRVATELQSRAKTLQYDSRLVKKERLTQWKLKRLHQQWSRTAGGAAGPTGSQILSGQTTSKTYAGSRLQRHAQAQQRYRAKYRSGQRSVESGTYGANAYISKNT